MRTAEELEAKLAEAANELSGGLSMLQEVLCDLEDEVTSFYDNIARLGNQTDEDVPDDLETLRSGVEEAVNTLDSLISEVEQLKGVDLPNS